MLNSLLSFGSMFFACLPVLAGPWLFGAWEMWWFWPFAVCLFVSLALFAVRLVVAPAGALPEIRRRRPAAWLAATYGLFLLYALLRLLGADVFADAERSFLLFLTPLLLGVVIVFGFSGRQLRVLGALVAVNLLALGLYGIINHFVTYDEKVLWEAGYPQYIGDGRATGSYFCPNHFAGIMELALAAALGALLARGARWRRRGMALALGAVAVCAIVLSKSRGGGLSAGVVFLFALAWGFGQWRGRVRWALRTAAVLAVAAAALAVAVKGRGYIERFQEYPWQQTEAMDRYQMISAALRAWRTAPVAGIGPGMHQNIWTHIAASPDGDRARGKWPSAPNYTFHSYEVHSDWTQLLEEYGIVGLFLFAIPAGVLIWILMWGRKRALRRQAESRDPEAYGAILTALFAFVAMAFHSLGDFNMQMPATVWTLAAILSIPLAHVLRE